jgi:hypothetical protein
LGDSSYIQGYNADIVEPAYGPKEPTGMASLPPRNPISNMQGAAKTTIVEQFSENIGTAT